MTQEFYLSDNAGNRISFHPGILAINSTYEKLIATVADANYQIPLNQSWDLSDNMVGHYALEDNAADTIVANQGSGPAAVAGANTSTMASATRKVGHRAFNFGGADPEVNGGLLGTAVADAMNPGNDWSIECWHYADTELAAGELRTIIGYINPAGAATATRFQVLILEWNNGGALAIFGRVYSTTGVWLDTTSTFAGTEWNHWVLTYSAATTTLTLYKNGVAETPDSTPTGTLADPAGKSFYMGKTVAGASIDPLDGKLDEVIVYNKTLSLAEVGYRYRSGIGTPLQARTAGLKAGDIVSVSAQTGGGLYLGIADVTVDANKLWCCPLNKTITFQIPITATILYFAGDTANSVGILRVLT